MPHSVISARRELYEEKAYEACELRKQAVERLLFFVGESKEFLASFQSLQDQFHHMVSRHVADPPPEANGSSQIVLCERHIPVREQDLSDDAYSHM